MLAPIGGYWVGWSCAYSVYGAPLPVPQELCAPDAPAVYGFQELSIEALLQLQEPATGCFVERETAKLMPDQLLPVQSRAGELTQIHSIGNGFVQDKHFEDDVWVLQTVIPGVSDDERMRVGLMFDNARGGLVQGIRVWQELRWSPKEAVESPLAELSRGDLAAEWLAASGDVDCFADAQTRAPSVSDTLSTGRVVLPGVGLTVRSARGMVIVEATGKDGRPTADRQPFVRTFDQRSCRARDGGAKAALLTTVSARATKPRSAKTKMSATTATILPATMAARALSRIHARVSPSLRARVAALVATTCLLTPVPPLWPAAAAAAAPSSGGATRSALVGPAVAADDLEDELLGMLEAGGVGGSGLSASQMSATEGTVRELEALGGTQLSAASNEGMWELPFVGGWDVLLAAPAFAGGPLAGGGKGVGGKGVGGKGVGGKGVGGQGVLTIVSARQFIWGPGEGGISTECVYEDPASGVGSLVLLSRIGSVSNLAGTDVRLDFAMPLNANRVSMPADGGGGGGAATVGTALPLDTVRGSAAGVMGSLWTTTYLSERMWVMRSPGDGGMTVLRRTDAEAIRPPSKKLYGKVYSLKYSEE